MRSKLPVVSAISALLLSPALANAEMPFDDCANLARGNVSTLTGMEVRISDSTNSVTEQKADFEYTRSDDNWSLTSENTNSKTTVTSYLNIPFIYKVIAGEMADGSNYGSSGGLLDKEKLKDLIHAGQDEVFECASKSGNVSKEGEPPQFSIQLGECTLKFTAREKSNMAGCVLDSTSFELTFKRFVQQVVDEDGQVVKELKFPKPENSMARVSVDYALPIDFAYRTRTVVGPVDSGEQLPVLEWKVVSVSSAK